MLMTFTPQFSATKATYNIAFGYEQMITYPIVFSMHITPESQNPLHAVSCKLMTWLWILQGCYSNIWPFKDSMLRIKSCLLRQGCISTYFWINWLVCFNLTYSNFLCLESKFWRFRKKSDKLFYEILKWFCTLKQSKK